MQEKLEKIKFSYLLCSAFTLYCTWFYYVPSFGKLETDFFEGGYTDVPINQFYEMEISSTQ